MQSKKKKYLITSALPYANGSKHIGHLAGAYLPADIFVRYLRLKGESVVYICGSDENGTAIANQAIKEKTSPEKIINKYHHLIHDCLKKFQISFDYYDRTSNVAHHKTAQDIFLQLEKKGVFEKQESEQFFDPQHHKFLADRYIKGTCPRCRYDEAYGDQCESCGASLSPLELIDPVSTLSNSRPILKKTLHWYLPLKQYEPWLKKWLLEGKKSQFKSHVYGQCKSWIEGGLASRAVTRDLDWGIEVPLEEAKNKVLYVWFDAPIGYISATQQWAKKNGKRWQDYWMDDKVSLVHFIGKDNIVFHCIIFPVILKALGNYILPENVPANEFLNLEGDKMSTSKGWSIEMEEYLEDFPEQIDELRYSLISILPESGDSEFLWAQFQEKVNQELVSILGNFINRVCNLMHNFFNGEIKLGNPYYSMKDKELKTKVEKEMGNYHQYIKQYRFKDTLKSAMNIARIGNKYLSDTAPWKLIHDSPKKTQIILYDCLCLIRELTLYLEPFLPITTKKMQAIFPHTPMHDFQHEAELEKLTVIKHIPLLFDKIEDQQVTLQKEKLFKKVHRKAKIKPMKKAIKKEDFDKVDIRIGTIIHATKHPNADKLLVLKINLGDHHRQIISGIAEIYQAKDIIGKQVFVLINLLKKEIRGEYSEGMVLTCQDSKNNLSLLEPTKKMKNGSEIN